MCRGLVFGRSANNRARFFVAAWVSRGLPSRNGREYLKFCTPGAGNTVGWDCAALTTARGQVGTGESGGSPSYMTGPSKVCSKATLTTGSPKCTMPKLSGLGIASNGSGAPAPTMSGRGHTCCSGVRRATHCSGSLTVFGRSAVAGTTCTILNPRVLSSLRMSGSASAVAGWMSCSSNMPLPRASIRQFNDTLAQRSLPG